MELWHYTHIDKCINILNSRQLWMSRYIDTNDSSDCGWANELLKNSLPEKLKHSFKEKLIDHPILKKKIRSGTITIAHLKKEIEANIDTLFKCLLNRKAPGPFDGYMLSFSQRDDRNGDHGRLSMWRGYGGGKPIALVFDSETLLENIKCLYPEPTFSWILEPVEYTKNDLELEDKFPVEIVRLSEVLLRFDGDPQSITSEGPGKTMGAIWNLTAKVKHPGFYEENEIRLFIYAPNPDSSRIDGKFKENIPLFPYDKNSNGKRIIKLNLQDAFNKPLKKIILGPESSNNEKRSIIDALSKLNMRCSVIQSEIPFLHSK